MFVSLLFAATLSGAQITAIDAAAEKSMNVRHVPSVVVAVDRDGHRIFQRAYGYRNIADKLPAQISTTYEYGSLTKQFTAMGIFLLAQDGKLDLKADIGTWFPKFANRGITVEHLLIHTSGVPDLINDSGPLFMMKYAALPFITSNDVIAWAEDKPLAFPVGTKAQYSNTGYLMLGQIIEKVSGQDLDTFFATRIFAPLGMATAQGYQLLKPIPNFANGYSIWDKELADQHLSGSDGIAVGSVVNAVPWNMRNSDAAGYLIGRADDLQKWDEALLSGKLLSGKWRTQYFARGVLADGAPAFVGAENPGKARAAYCYGGFATVTQDGHQLFLANGGTSGFATFTATIPDLRIAVTTLTNLGGSNNSDLTTPVLDALLVTK